MDGLQRAFRLWLLFVALTIRTQCVRSQGVQIRRSPAKPAAPVPDVDAVAPQPATQDGIADPPDTGAEAPTAGDPCSDDVEPGTRRPGSTFFILSTSSPEECCRRCREDSRCLSWDRRRSSGVCSLKSSIPEAIDGGDEFDSGAKDDEIFGGDTPDDEVPDNAPCRTQGGFRPGNPLRSTNVRSSGACCRRCDNTVGCVAWNYQISTGRCELLPSAIAPTSTPGFITGTTFG